MPISQQLHPQTHGATLSSLLVSCCYIGSTPLTPPKVSGTQNERVVKMKRVCACRSTDFAGQLLEKAIPPLLHPHTSTALFHSLCLGLELLVVNFALSNEQRSKVTHVTANRFNYTPVHPFWCILIPFYAGVQNVSWTRVCQLLGCWCLACTQVVHTIVAM